MSQYFSTNAQFYIGDSSSSKNTFSGFIRHVKLFSKYRSVGQSRLSLRNEMATIYHQRYLLALYPLSESIGYQIREQVTGNQIQLNSNNHQWITLPERPIMCNGESFLSSRGYCSRKYNLIKLIQFIAQKKIF